MNFYLRKGVPPTGLKKKNTFTHGAAGISVICAPYSIYVLCGLKGYGNGSLLKWRRVTFVSD